MKQLTLDLLAHWGEGLVILSPRDVKEEVMLRLSKQIHKKRGEVCFDPQFYLPHSDLKKLKDYSFWPSTYDTMAFWSSGQLDRLVIDILKKNAELDTKYVILPGLLAPRVDVMWLKYQEMIRESAKKHQKQEKMLMTIALGGKAVRDDSQIQAVLDASNKWDVDGFYVVLEHPDSNYIVSDETWMTNAMELCAGLKVRGKIVVFGYSNQQMLSLACANVDYICSGSWMNVRVFPQDKFMESEAEFRNKSIWIYSPDLFSEFKVNTLDAAKKSGLIGAILPKHPHDVEPGKKIYIATQPSLIAEFNIAFFYYLDRLRNQAETLKLATFDTTMSNYLAKLDHASTQVTLLKSSGIKSAPRDISLGQEAVVDALNMLVLRRRGQLKRKW
ncbi:hypothetical protein HNQ07_004293 [Deinococcus metalli]|nr:hypothetical protein [Deinococcus metalli]MBB5378786.1 hypothetical protein [Deinococcus metalli]